MALVTNRASGSIRDQGWRSRSGCVNSIQEGIKEFSGAQ